MRWKYLYVSNVDFNCINYFFFSCRTIFIILRISFLFFICNCGCIFFFNKADYFPYYQHNFPDYFTRAWLYVIREVSLVISKWPIRSVYILHWLGKTFTFLLLCISLLFVLLFLKKKVLSSKKYCIWQNVLAENAFVRFYLNKLL